MDWVQFGLLIVAMGGMFQWLKADIAANRAESSADRRDLLQIIREMKEENKNFHARQERQDAEYRAHMFYFHSEKKQ